MNIIKLILITLIIIEGLVLNVWAADFQIGNIVSGGSGCPNGAEHIISYSIQDNGKKLRFSFEGVELRHTNDRAITRVSCNLVLPMEIAPGKRVKFILKEVENEMDIAPMKSAKISIETFFAGDQAVSFEQQYGGPICGKIKKSVATDLFSTRLSYCGEKSNLRINNSFLIKQNESTISGISKFKMKTLVYEVESVDCI